jgi:hypothetical protein
MSLIVATKKKIQKVEMLPTTCKVFSMSLQLPQVFGSLDRKKIYLENKMVAYCRKKRRPRARTLGHYPVGIGNSWHLQLISPTKTS